MTFRLTVVICVGMASWGIRHSVCPLDRVSFSRHLSCPPTVIKEDAISDMRLSRNRSESDWHQDIPDIWRPESLSPAEPVGKGISNVQARAIGTPANTSQPIRARAKAKGKIHQDRVPKTKSTHSPVPPWGQIDRRKHSPLLASNASVLWWRRGLRRVPVARAREVARVRVSIRLWDKQSVSGGSDSRRGGELPRSDEARDKASRQNPGDAAVGPVQQFPSKSVPPSADRANQPPRPIRRDASIVRSVGRGCHRLP